MSRNDRERAQALSLCALLDCLTAVRELATQGRTDLARRSPLLDAILDFDGAEPATLYGPAFDFAPGARAGAAMFSRTFTQSDELLRLAAEIIALSSRLRQSASAGAKLQTALQTAIRQRDAFGISHDYTVQSFAQAYVDGVAPLGARIMVSGDPTWLKQERVAAQIRALLLAAMRAAILWRHLGGSLWSLWLRRRTWQARFAAIAGPD